MIELTLFLLRAVTMAFRGHHDVVLENLALRHQLRTLQRRMKRPHLRTRDRMFWVLLGRIVHVNVTEHPTAAWTAQQLVDAFPEDSAPRYLLRDRDSIYDDQVRRRIASLGITEVVSSPLSPWQNPYVERVIGSIRRECLDHVIILNPRHLRRLLRAYLA